MKHTIVKIYLFVLCIGFGTFINYANATVGGATIIYDLKYDTGHNLIYYTEHSQSGKGCPPELKSLDVFSKKVGTIISCDQQFQVKFDPNSDVYHQRIDSVTNPFTNLSPVDLRKNNITAELVVVGTSTIEEWKIKNDFIATIKQDGVEKMKIPITGCYADQPFLITGYSIPGSKSDLALLFSNKSDCFEGGYTKESLYVVGDINLVNSDQVNYYKGREVATVSGASIVAYVSDGTEVSQESSTASRVTWWQWLIPGLVIGYVLGLVTRRKSKAYQG